MSISLVTRRISDTTFDMLSAIPTEILSHVALHLSLSSNPPSPPIALLLTSKSIYNSLSYAGNPDLYARLYRACFDTQAVERRMGPQEAASLVAELKRRVRCLRKLNALVRQGDVRRVVESDLWVVYLMLLENGTSHSLTTGLNV